jgi:hypothetical protein
MLYTETDRANAAGERTKRLVIAIVPAAVLFLLAIASFIWYRYNRNAGGWPVTGLLTIAAGAYFLFFYEVYARPVSLYKRHIDYMLDAHKRETIGILKEISQTVQDKDGLDCRMVTVNIGDKDAAEDERSFYLDALIPVPEVAAGTRVKILSNDRMVAGLDPAE